ncbi:hypothetical protein [uncultured Erythrobacter sp.]|uniref:hypothetical protein n=1 Tax=uncultured Erythrobacter sp. TaxID=263913 RepID=UPI00262D679B|nr:hypothetical protein [uncultured Erythrobacter sp.]
MAAKRVGIATIFVPGLLLAACDGSGGAEGPGSVSVDEAKALDEAAEMLEERRLPEGALPPVSTPQQEVGEEEVE